ncbi:MAG: type II toxin-antitoxin system VapB family antitoxin [Geminicoccaceae bacterium]
MGLFIRDDEVRVLAKRLAVRRGQTVTEVVRQALKRACEEDEQAVEAKLRALDDIRARVGTMPELRPGFTDNDLYDEDGNPIL